MRLLTLRPVCTDLGFPNVCLKLTSADEVCLVNMHTALKELQTGLVAISILLYTVVPVAILCPIDGLMHKTKTIFGVAPVNFDRENLLVDPNTDAWKCAQHIEEIFRKAAHSPTDVLDMIKMLVSRRPSCYSPENATA